MFEHIADALRGLSHAGEALAARRREPRTGRATFIAVRDESLLRGLTGRA